MLPECCLDLAKLDAESAELHLCVETTEIFDLSVHTPTGQITRAIQARTLARLLPERVGHKTLGRELGSIDVPTREVDAADVELTGHTNGCRRHPVIKDMDPGVGDRASDRNGVRLRAEIDGPLGHVNRRFGRAVEIVQRTADTFGTPPRRLPGQRFATGKDAPERRQALRSGFLKEHLQHRRHEVNRGDALARDEVGQIRGVTVSAGFGDGDRRPKHEGPEQLPDGHVEADRRFVQDHI